MAHLLVNPKEKVNKLSKSGFYTLSCKYCEVTHEGRTIRPLSTK